VRPSQRLFTAREFFSRTLAPSTDRSTQNFAMFSLQFLAVATLRDETPCPPIQPRPQSCSVDAPQTISLLADPPWRIAANLSDVDDAFAASYLQKNLSAIVHLPIVDLNASIATHIIAIERGGNGTSVEAYTLQASARHIRLSGVTCRSSPS